MSRQDVSRQGAPPRLPRDPAGREFDAALAHLELTVRVRLDGLLHGNYVGLLPGPGSESGESRQYDPGDDVRRMDWPVTARTTVPHVRQTIADRELETWVVMDLSPSLDFGTAGCEKRDLAVAALAAVVYLTQRGGNRIGALIIGGGEAVRVPALPGRAHAQGLLRRVARTPRAATGQRGDLAAAAELMRRPPRRRGLVVLVSDFLGEYVDGYDWERPTRALAAHHEVLAVEVVDPRELSLPAVGMLTVVDPETGQEVEVQTSDRRLRDRYAAAAAAQRAAIAGSLRRAGAAQLRLSTDGDWLLDIVRFVAARRRGVSGGAAR
ncbi:MAG: DUF58 domain-containing protein [Actinobacteria bacterium]|nr:DUF58 domain-containing protein [Actinomycetota bacterium]